MTLRRGAWFHCFAGIAGDMALGSLLDAGADEDEVVAILRRLPVPEWRLETSATMRNGIAATAVGVVVEETAIVRTHSHIVGLIEEGRLPDRVRDRALAAFAVLAEVEGRLHRRLPAQVHFHEVGGVDAIVDVVGTCAALEVLGIDEVHSSAVATGTGMTRSAHGALPNPAPAVVELLRGAPTYGRDIGIELTTPTGAALLAALVSGWGPLPAMTISATGYGAGSAELAELPNLTQVVVGDLAVQGPAADAGQPVVLLEANVDDATGETLAYALVKLLEEGALDAWLTPVLMKKGRPAFVVSALADPALVGQVAACLSAETGSLGVRCTHLERWPAVRSEATVDVDGMAVRVKVSPGRTKAEHDDVVRVARVTGLPLREVRFRAERTWRDAERTWRDAGGPEDEPA